jgi:hypothetical protein
MSTFRARRALLLGLALFVLAQVVLAVAVLRDGATVRDPAYGAKLQRLKRRLAASPRPLLAVQLGSSRTAYGFWGLQAEPDLAQRLGRPVVLFNMGFFGFGPVANLVTLRRLLDDGVHPEVVLIEVLPLLLREGPSVDARTEQFPAARLRYREMRLLANHVRAERPQLEWHWWLAQATAIHDHRLGLLTLAAPSLLPVTYTSNPGHTSDEGGWLPLPRVPPHLERSLFAVTHEETAGNLQRFQLSQRYLDVLAETVELARREGVQPALVLLPEGPAYRNWYPPGLWEQIDAALRRLAQRYRVPLFDLRATVGETDFIDSHHLYPEGAKTFTRLLARRIEPLLRPACRHPEGRP